MVEIPSRRDFYCELNYPHILAMIETLGYNG